MRYSFCQEYFHDSIRVLYVVYIICLCSGFPVAVTGATDKEMQTLVNDLISYSHKEIRPWRNISETLTIEISLQLNNLLEVDFQRRTLTVKISVSQVWNNYLHRWDPELYGGITDVVLPATKVWVPDLAIFNGVETDTLFHGSHVKVSYVGYSEWKSTRTARVHCAKLKDIGNYPYDEYSCFLKVASWTYDTSQVDFRHKAGSIPVLHPTHNHNDSETNLSWKVNGPGIDLSEYYTNTIWEIVQTDAYRYYTCCDNSFSDIRFSLTLKRKQTIFADTVMFIWIFLSIFPCLALLVPVETNQKVGLAAMNFILCLGIIGSLHTQSKLFLMKDSFCFTLILDFVTIFMSVIVVTTHSRQSRMPKVLKTGLRVIARITCVNYAEASDEKSHLDSKSHQIDTSDGSQSVGIQWIGKYLQDEESITSAKSRWICLATSINRLCLTVTLFTIVVKIFLLIF